MSFEEKDNLARKKIDKILMTWFTEDAILLYLCSMFNIKSDMNQDSFGINILGRHPVITYNPNFVNRLPLEQMEMVMVHTLFKVLLRHCTSRLQQPFQISALSSNIAIDELIRDNSMVFLLADKSLQELIPTASQFKLPVKDSFEEYFRRLNERQTEINRIIKEVWDSLPFDEKMKLIEEPEEKEDSKTQPKYENSQTEKSEDEITSDRQSNNNIDEDFNEEDLSNNNEDNINETNLYDNPQEELESKEEPKEKIEEETEIVPEHKDDSSNNNEEIHEQNQSQSVRDEDGFKEYKESTECMKDYFDPNGSANKGWGASDMIDADIKNLIDKYKDRIKSWGKHTGNHIGEILAANNPKISYKEIIRKFKKSVDTYTHVSSRLKVNRRYDLDCPGHRRFLKTRIIFAIDTSCSMTDDDLAEGFSVINKILKHSEIIYVLFDTEIKLIETKIKKARSSFKVSGRGGTDFNEIMKMADETKCDGIVVYTDGVAVEPKQPKCKVLWLTPTKGYTIPWSWGFRATLDRYENTHTF